MLDSSMKLERKEELSVNDVSVRLVLNENETSMVSFYLPSPLDLNELNVDSNTLISLEKMTNQLDVFNMETWLDDEIFELEAKKERFGGSPIFHTHLANMYEFKSDIVKSLHHREKAIELSQNLVFKHNKASTLKLFGQTNEFKQTLIECNIVNDEVSSLGLALSEMEARNLEGAREYASICLSSDCLNSGARMLMGAISLIERDPQEAIRHYKVAQDLQPLSAPVLVNMAFAYCQLKQFDQALRALKRALVIDLLDENALIFYADLAFDRQEIADSIVRMERFVEFERDKPEVWERLARAYFFSVTESDSEKKQSLFKALECLKNQNAISVHATIYNNIGLVYSELGDKKKALRFVSLAFTQSEKEELKEQTFHNLIYLHYRSGSYQEAIKIVEANFDNLVHREELSKCVQKTLLHYVRCLEKVNKTDVLIKVVEKLSPLISYPEYLLEFYTGLVYLYAVESPNKHGVVGLIDPILKASDNISDKSNSVMVRAINNLCFALYSFDEKQAADDLMPFIMNYINRDPYVTATFGMSLIMKGKIDRGESYYNNAIAMLTDNLEKKRFKQRRDYEIGKILIECGDSRRAKRLLLKAKNESKGLQSVALDATRCLRLLNDKLS
ncbi:tetratricopeptide repeat protein [Alteromonas macleodii]|uniref:tetratricopeptide repeat protein n=1 Tax=Alteromonas macleodii TaxID=28108 RepID=UPI003BF892A1